MNYPNITQYKEAIEFSEDTLKELNHLEPVRRANGELYFSSGNFAVVFKLYDRAADKYYALKCFLRDAPERKARYVHTHAYISQLNCPYLLACDFLEDEIYADDREIEVLCMEWVEGKLLGVLIRELCEADDHTGLDALYQQFKIMALNISQLDFAHGDIKHDNVIVTESFGYQYTLKLIDYDGMYVPALRGQQAQELGGKSYQHPLRDASHFDKDLDSFSVYLILLSLAVLRERPEWYEAYNSGENILFSQADLLDWENSKLVSQIRRELKGDLEITKWMKRLSDMLKKRIVIDIHFGTALTRNPKDVYLNSKDLKISSEHNVRTGNPVIDQLIADLIYVEGGTFQMGATAEQGSDAFNNEKPVHTVTLDGFYMGKTPVTQAQWEAVMGNNPAAFKGDTNRPVETVSWYDCQEFVKELNRLTGLEFALPTEAQWEFAARGGVKSRGFKYAGSDNIDEVAWYDSNSRDTTHPVGQKNPNELGLYDMSGNVWEWCADYYGTYPSTAVSNPIGPASGDYQVYRGGSWCDNAWGVRVSRRNRWCADFRFNGIGFRLVCPRP